MIAFLLSLLRWLLTPLLPRIDEPLTLRETITLVEDEMGEDGTP